MESLTSNLLIKNRLGKCTISGGKQLRRKEHGQFEQHTSNKKNSVTLTVAG